MVNQQALTTRAVWVMSVLTLSFSWYLSLRLRPHPSISVSLAIPSSFSLGLRICLAHLFLSLASPIFGVASSFSQSLLICPSFPRAYRSKDGECDSNRVALDGPVERKRHDALEQER